MTATRIGKPTALAASLLLALAGCNGKTEDVDTAIVTIEPGVSVTASPGASAPATANPAADPPPAKAAESAAPAAAPATTKAEGWGTLKGRVIFGGDPPAQKVLVAKGDPNAKDAKVCSAREILSQRLVVDKTSKGVKYAVVFIPKPTAVNPDARAAALKKEVVFDQRDCLFDPHVLAVMKGEKVVIKQDDPGVSHNVHSYLQNFSLNAAMQTGQTSVVEPKAAERLPGPIVCDIHKWMSAYWLVADNPYFAVTDEKGNFEIKDVPAGTQKVVVWQEATGPVTPGVGEPLDIKAGGETTKDFTVDPGKVKPEG